VKRPVSIVAAKHLLAKLAEHRAAAEAKFPESARYSREDRAMFVLAMLEGTLEYFADPVGK
jgi:hypothetical protein